MNDSPIEREIKLAVDLAFVMPDLSGAGLEVVDHGVIDLDAVYWDTPRIDVSRAGHGLRHRRADGDRGIWTLKGRSRRDGHAMVRAEVEYEGDADAIPEAIRQLLPPGIEASALGPVAWLRTVRHRRDVIAADASRLVELADDRVAIIDECGATIERFREIEVELLNDAAGEAAGQIVRLLRIAGAAAPNSTSKLGRALHALGYQDVNACID